MIKTTKSGSVEVEGNLVDLTFEWVLISHTLHDLMAEDLGDGGADEMMLHTLLAMLSGKFELKCEDGEDGDGDDDDGEWEDFPGIDDIDWEDMLE